MKVVCKPIIITEGTPRTVAASMWADLCAPGRLFPRMAGLGADCALAYVRELADGRQALVFLQCMRVHFDACGYVYSWNMSTLHLTRECVLGPRAQPQGKYTKYRQEPHYWFPDAAELTAMARALAPRPGSSLKNEVLRATLRPTRTAMPPFMVPSPPRASTTPRAGH